MSAGGSARWVRRWHRWLGLLCGLPCLLWGVSGTILSWKNYATLSAPGNPEAVAGAHAPFVLPVEEALRRTGRPGPPAQVEWRWLLGSPRYVIHFAGGPAVIVDGRSGAVDPPVDEALARRIAQADAPPGVRVLGVRRQEQATLVYRAWQELPAYRATLSNGDEVYLSPRSGEVQAHVDGTFRLIRGSFYALHTWDLSSAPGPHWSYLLLWAMALGLLCLAATGIWLAYLFYVRPR